MSVRVDRRVGLVLVGLAIMLATLTVVHVQGFPDGRWEEVARTEGCFCHGDGSNQLLNPNDPTVQNGQPDPGVEVTLDDNVPAAGYVPNAVYELTLTVSCGTSSECHSGPPENEQGASGGFNMVAGAGAFLATANPEAASYKVGDSHCSPPDCPNQGTQATHNSVDGNKQRSWSVAWRAPPSGTGPARIYAVANAVNGDRTFGPPDRWNWVGYDDNGNGEIDASEKYVQFPEGQPPTAPTGVALEAGDGELILSWNAANGQGFSVEEYKVYRNATDAATLIPFETLGAGATSFTDTNVTEGLEYSYAVSAVNEVGEGPLSATVLGALAAPPGTPKDLTATPGDGLVNLAWAAPGSGGPPTSYRVYRGTAPDALAQQAEVDGTSYEDTNVTNGETYHYAVAGVNAEGEGPLTATVQATPQAGLDLAPTVAITEPAEGAEVGSPVVVNGTASDPEGALDRVEVRVDGGNWTAVEGTAAWTMTRELGPGGHRIDARAFDATQASPVASVNVTVLADDVDGGGSAELGVPANLRAERLDDAIRLTWDPVEGADGYAVDRSLGGAFFRLAETNATTYLDQALVQGAVHRYRVSALADGGVSTGQPSDPVEATVEGAGPVEGVSPTLVIVALAAAGTVVALVVLHRLR